jgi:hypothetical protein
MEIIRPSPPKTYRTRRRKPAAQPKSYRVVAEEVDGQKFQRVELAFRWMPWIMGGVLTVTLLLAYSLFVMSGWPVSLLTKPASIRCCGSSPIWIGRRLKWMRTFCGSAMRGKSCFRQKKTPPDRSGGVFAYGTVRNGAGATVAGTTANGCLRRRFRRFSTALRSPLSRSRSLRVVSAKAPNPINSTICKSAVTTATAPCGNSSGRTGLSPIAARSARAASRSATRAARSAASPSSLVEQFSGP